jgi:glutamine synthetase
MLESLKSWLHERNISEVECLIPDMTGNARGKIMPADKFAAEEGMRLPESLFIQTVTGEWPEDASMVDPTEQDMILRPDPQTVRLVPWADEPTAQVIHDCYDQQGNPVDISPRAVLRQVLALYEAREWRPVVAPELEFFLVKQNVDPDYPLEPPVGRSGRQESARQSFSIDAINEFDPVLNDIYDYCELQAIEVDTLVHESGAAQMEINFAHGDALSLSDQVFLFKRTVREAALRHGIYATFMAKPMAREPGSSMHIHHSIVDANGRNLFSTAENEYTPAFLSFIAGLQTYLPSAMSLFAPNVNSYRRIAKHESAPINTHWGYDNRTVGLRVPMCTPASMRLENRVAGADANPYLAVAASLACGYLGMTGNLEPSDPVQDSGYDLPYGLPRSLEEALRHLGECGPLQALLGERFVRAYAAVKEKEYETFLRVISSWEREFLLLNV